MEYNDKYTAENYLDYYLRYYDQKSISCKKWYTALVVSDIVISAFIPFITLFIDIFSSTKFIIAFMGSIVTIVSSFKSTFGFHKNWIEYRTTTEILRYHKYLFETGCPPYSGENRSELLISNVRAIMEKENRSWRSAELSDKKSSPKNQ